MEHLTPSEKKALLLQNASGHPFGVVSELARRLDSDYFNEFTLPEIEGHVARIAGLSPAAPFSFEFSPIDDHACGLTVIGEDLPGFFSALSGLLASYDFDIRLGKVFTYAAEIGETGAGDSAYYGKAPVPKGKIIDYLLLEHDAPGLLTSEFQAILLEDLNGLIGLLRARKTRELRTDLYRRIGAYLSRKAGESDMRGLHEARLPLEIQVETDDRHAILTIRGTDRKALLFSLSNALALQGASIRKLLTRSQGDAFEDRIFITDADGNPISNPHTLERLKVAIVLMERFMSTLPQASDYPAAVQTFNDFIDALVDRSAGSPDLPAFEDFTFLSSLAKILGAGPFLWEEMTKLPLAEVTGLLRRLDEERKPCSRRDLDLKARMAMSKEDGHHGKVAALNMFKDFQLFRLDVLHLVFPHKTLQEFSAEISDVAEVTLANAMSLAYRKLAMDHGEPRSGGEPCPFGLFAQGKLGGRELGYASDLEIQLLYEYSGETTGGQSPGGHGSISNGEFFSRLVGEMRSSISARSEGIFELDLRLRPHGDSGPLASQFERWQEYYGPGGGALDYERQALLKLRPVSPEKAFADRVMAARDRLIFGETPVPIAHTLGLRDKQAQLKGSKGLNAKFSPGGLVDVEYTVQFLQLLHGRRLPSLRDPNTEICLENLLEEGILDPGEFEKLYQGYVFMRRLINALRMVRGHSRDLVVPPRGSHEFLLLAKRMGYLATPRYEPDAQLDWDLSHAMRAVRGIFARRFLAEGPGAAGQAEDPDPAGGGDVSVSAAFMGPEAAPEKVRRALQWLGIRDVLAGKAFVQGMLDQVREKGILCAALVVAAPKLRASPDPEAVLRHLGQYLEAIPDPDYFVRQLLNHPYLSEMLIKAFGHSDYLATILQRQPDYLMALGDPRSLEKPKLASEFGREIGEMSLELRDLREAMDLLRRYRNREYLRIGLRDIYLGETLPRITAEISQLSNALIESVFSLTMAAAETAAIRDGVCVIALGKLGGNELNYSSDIDIVFVFDPERVGPGCQAVLEGWARGFIAALSDPGTHGKMFRVDTQLRPYGSGCLVASVAHYADYFAGAASGWELQAWLKARPLAGNTEMGRQVVAGVQALAVSPANRIKIESSMRAVRQLGLEKLKQENRLSSEVKLGPGGIRTIEFYVQYLQILHGQAVPELISGNTLAVLGRLHRYRLLGANYFELLTKSYVFLRRIEHVLQLQGLQQRHELPASPEELEKLAKRMGFEERLGESASSQFRARYRQHMLTLLELSGTLFGYDTNLPADKAPPDAERPGDPSGASREKK